MKPQSNRKVILLLVFFSVLSLSLAGCYNSGMRFLRDVNQTVCCFSPALALAPAAAAVLIARRPGS